MATGFSSLGCFTTEVGLMEHGSYFLGGVDALLILSFASDASIDMLKSTFHESMYVCMYIYLYIYTK